MITSLPVQASISKQQYCLFSIKFNCLRKNMLEQPAMNKFLRDSTYNQLLLANMPTLWLHTPMVPFVQMSTPHTYMPVAYVGQILGKCLKEHRKCCLHSNVVDKCLWDAPKCWTSILAMGKYLGKETCLHTICVHPRWPNV